MSKCPECQTPSSDDFGLSTCGNCGATFFAGAESGSDNENLSSFEVEEDVFVDSKEQEPETPEDYFGVSNEESENSENMNVEEPENVHSEGSLGMAANTYENETPLPEVEMLSSNHIEKSMQAKGSVDEGQNSENCGQGDLNKVEYQDDGFNSHEQEISEAASDSDLITDTLSEKSTKSDGAFYEEVVFEENAGEHESQLSDIAKFANSEVASAKEGPLLTYIKIGEVVSKEDKILLHEYLNDPKFGWSADKIMGTETQGVVSINAVSALKAAIIIQQLKSEKFKITWELKGVVES
ncbi:MAG: hypothetical protein HOO06_12820 [Bdellovibrionaceae bacterium]|jgi:hypothetical protein|nr:hypothetical protein [Pseudobdellovibrionaceae bacterium]